MGTEDRRLQNDLLDVVDWNSKGGKEASFVAGAVIGRQVHVEYGGGCCNL